MHERRQDFELLQDFARQGGQAAFSALVNRHLNLVYSTALRKIGDPGAAEEVVQNVFAALARKAWKFAPDDSLTAWLHRTTLLEAKEWWRSELRRRRREQQAAALGTTMRTPDEPEAWRALVPLLDEALLSLREKERAALLLRFYENQPFREVGSALGVSEDAAQKRVTSALDKLVRFFQRRGFKAATLLTTTAVLQQTAASAPVALPLAVLQAALQAGVPTLAGAWGWLGRLASLTKAQTAAACLLLVAAPIVWQVHQRFAAQKEAAALTARFDTLRAEEQRVSAELDRLQTESTRLDVALADTERQARLQEAARKLAAWKAQAHSLLTHPSSRWSDDLPYVRIPKGVIKELGLQSRFDGSGALSEAARELLGITAEEQLQTERALGEYLQGVENLSAARAYETNLPSSQPGRLTKTVIIPPLGQELKTLAQDTGAQLARVLGADREQLLFGGWDEGAIQFFWPGNLWRISEEPQTLTVWVDPTVMTTNGPLYGSSRSSVFGGTSGERFGSRGIPPSAINTRFFLPWLRQHGITNF